MTDLNQFNRPYRRSQNHNGQTPLRSHWNGFNGSQVTRPPFENNNISTQQYCLPPPVLRVPPPNDTSIPLQMSSIPPPAQIWSRGIPNFCNYFQRPPPRPPYSMDSESFNSAHQISFKRLYSPVNVPPPPLQRPPDDRHRVNFDGNCLRSAAGPPRFPPHSPYPDTPMNRVITHNSLQPPPPGS